MTEYKTTYPQFLKNLLIVHMAITMSQLILIALIFVLINEDLSSVDINTRNTIMILAPIIIFILIIAGRTIYQQKLKNIRTKNDLKIKLSDYKILHIIHIAIIEAGSCLCFGAAFLSQNTVFVYGSIALVLYLLSLRPSKAKLENELQLNFKELNQLENPDYIVQVSRYSDTD